MSAGPCFTCPECSLARALEGFGLAGVVGRLAKGARDMARQASPGVSAETEAALDAALLEYADALDAAAAVLEKHGVRIEFSEKAPS